MATARKTTHEASRKAAPKNAAPTKRAPAKRGASGKRATPAKATPAKRPLGPVASLPPRAPGEVRYWLVKSEPDVFSIADLERERTTTWEGVRNFQARNAMIEMRLGDQALYYHSNAEPSGVAGVCEIVKLAYPDPTQFDPKSEYFDAGSKPADPRWKMVDVGFVERFPRTISLDELKAEAALDGMVVLQKGTRLSVTPVSRQHFEHVRMLARR